MSLTPSMAQTDSRVRDLTTSAVAGGQKDQLLKYLQNKIVQLTTQGNVGSPEYIVIAGQIQALKNANAKAQMAPPNERSVISDLLPAPLTPQAAPQVAPAPEDAGGVAAMDAPNMESIDMMGGGLVAFGDGGEVPRYQNQGIVAYNPDDPINRFFGNPDPKKRRPMTQDELDEYRRRKEMGLGDMFKEFVADPTKRAFAYNGREDLRPAKGEGIAGGDVEDQQGGYYGGATPAAGLPAVAAAAGTPTAGDKPTVKLKSDDAMSGLPAIKEPTYGDAMALGRQFAGSTADIEKQLKELPTEKQAAQNQFDVYKEMGVDLDPYKSLKASLEKEKSEEGKAKTEAGLMRLAEFGFAWASENGPALQAAAKAGKQVMPGVISDAKELKKLARERERTLADIAAVDSKMRKDITDAGLAKLQKRRETLEKRRDEINDNAARIGGTIFGQQLASQTQMATTGMSTRATMAKLEQQLGQDRAAKIVATAKDLVVKDGMYPAMTEEEKDAALNRAILSIIRGTNLAETQVTPRS